MSGQRKKSLRRPLDLDYCLGFSFLSAIQSTVIFLLLWLCFMSLLLDLFCSQFVLFSGHHVRSGSRTLSDDLYLPRRRAGSGNGRLETCTSGAGANLLTRSARSFECIKLCLCSRVWVCARYVKPVRCRIERLFFSSYDSRPRSFSSISSLTVVGKKKKEVTRLMQRALSTTHMPARE